MNTLDQVMEKVRKLLALAEGSANEHEAALAFARAQDLLDRHGLERAAIELAEPLAPRESIEESSFQTHAGAAASTWRVSLVAALGRANGCHCFYTRTRVTLTGTPSAARTVEYLYRMCAAEIDRLARRNARGAGATYANAYRHGCVAAVRDAIAADREAQRARMRTEAQHAGGSALLVLERAIVRVDEALELSTRYANAHHRLSTGRRASIGSSSGYGAGRRDGAGVYGNGSRPGLGSGPRRIG